MKNAQHRKTRQHNSQSAFLRARAFLSFGVTHHDEEKKLFTRSPPDLLAGNRAPEYICPRATFSITMNLSTTQQFAFAARSARLLAQITSPRAKQSKCAYGRRSQHQERRAGSARRAGKTRVSTLMLAYTVHNSGLVCLASMNREMLDKACAHAEAEQGSTEAQTGGYACARVCVHVCIHPSDQPLKEVRKRRERAAKNAGWVTIVGAHPSHQTCPPRKSRKLSLVRWQHRKARRIGGNKISKTPQSTKKQQDHKRETSAQTPTALVFVLLYKFPCSLTSRASSLRFPGCSSFMAVASPAENDCHDSQTFCT